MNLKEIKELIDLITEKSLAEFEMEKAGFKIKIVRTQISGSSPASVVAAAAPNYLPHQPVEATHLSPTVKETRDANPTVTAPTESREGLTAVKSPIVGTFYRASDPNASPFVKEGDKVAKGQTLCIIEAMKLMNEIEAETEGEIVRILVENGRPVEFGQELFLIRPRV